MPRKPLSEIGGPAINRRAAQYVRMSTTQQKYSIENQAAAIAAYAARRDPDGTCHSRHTPQPITDRLCLYQNTAKSGT